MTSTISRKLVELRPNSQNTFAGTLIWYKEERLLALVQDNDVIIPLGSAADPEHGENAMLIHEGFLGTPHDILDDETELYFPDFFDTPEREGLTLALLEIGAIAKVIVPSNASQMSPFDGNATSVVELTADLGACARPHALLENLSTTLSPAINMVIVDELIAVAALIGDLTDPQEIQNMILFRAKVHQRAAQLTIKEITTDRAILS